MNRIIAQILAELDELQELRPNAPQTLEPERLSSGSAQPTQETATQQSETQPTQTTRPRKTTRAGIRVGSLNMKGFGTNTVDSSQNKWEHINQIMNQKKIAILAIQETHMTEERRQMIEERPPYRLKIFASSSVINPTGRAGVAIVLNKHLLDVNDAVSTEIVPGRAILTTTRWYGEGKITVLNVYAPNVRGSDGTANAEFWRVIRRFLQENPNVPQPDVVLGDFNMVEDAIDRLPIAFDPVEAIEELDGLKTELNITDCWRNTYPTHKAYTFHPSHTVVKAISRLDRIYMTDTVNRAAREWKIEPTGLPGGDHWLVSVKVAHEAAPTVGRGRWVIPPHLIKDKELSAQIKKAGQAAMSELRKTQTRGRTEQNNAQLIFQGFKKHLVDIARARERKIIPRIQKEQEELKTRENDIKTDETLTPDERLASLADVADQLSSLERKRHQMARADISIRCRLYNEILCRTWTRANKEKKPRDLIQALRKPEGDTPINAGAGIYEKNSKRMADLARDHHSKLQTPAEHQNPAERETHIQNILAHIERQPDEAEKDKLRRRTTREDIEGALKRSSNNTAPGLDGIPFELWKTLNNRFVDDEAKNKESFDVLDLMQAAYNDTEQYGLVAGSKFTEGWMCPLYKKNDPTDIANYRPITLLNTDYKIFTKALADKLARIAPNIIHRSQAGFIPGRQISEQTRLIHMVMAYARAEEENGMIVALDQEKAYDRIDHGYLWQTLEAFGIPEEFIFTVKTLYASASTKVMINGCLSSPFQVRRGVRQGDPLSCLLFDLAIEPLAAALRNSPLQGFRFPRVEEKLIANLFADDTTVFLSETDSIPQLQEILDTWCIASTAKFNEGKTEIIPIGVPEYRNHLIQNRSPRNGGDRIPDHIHIVSDGEAARILGAWYSNSPEDATPWTPVLNKIDKALAQWNKGSPTIEGRIHIVQMTIGGMTQYLTQAQGMPKNIEQRLTKRIRTFMWKEAERGAVNEQTLLAPRRMGGKSVLDIEARNEAIQVMWAKAYLTMDETRPLWATVADEILAKHPIRTDANKTKAEARTNPFLQSWTPDTSKSSAVPEMLKNMLKITKKYGVRLEALAPARQIINDIPMWHHPFLNNAGKNLRWYTTVDECLRRKHGVMTVGDTTELAALTSTTGHRGRRNCPCNTCTNLRAEKGCLHPFKCARRARELANAISPRWTPTQTLPEDWEEVAESGGDGVVFDPRLTTHGSLKEAFRIFTQGEPHTALAAIPPRLEGNNVTAPDINVATDGSCLNNGEDNAQAGAGVFYAADDVRNIAARLPQEIAQTNQTGELIAIKLAVDSAPSEGRLLIESDSKYAIQVLATFRQRLEDEGFVDTPNRDVIKAAIASLRRRQGPTILKWVKGHSGHEQNEGADKLAGEGARKENPTTINLKIPPELRLTGSKLDAMEQATAYRAIREIKMEKTYKERKRSKENIKLIQGQVKATHDRSLAEAQIWRATRHRDFPKKLQYFMWMATHDAYCIGSYWQKPTYPEHLQARALCQHCGDVVESMSHILTECTVSGQEVIWSLAKELWELKGKEWIPITLGGLLTVATVTFENAEGRHQPGITRFYRILISESIHLIWKLRCRQKIELNDVPLSRHEIRSAWLKTINDRLNTDRRMTQRKFGERAIPRRLVAKTWEGTLLDEDCLSTKWTETAGVLVGMLPQISAGRGGVG